MLALERERGALGIVLVIAASRTRLDDPRELSPEPAQPLEDGCPLHRQQLRCASLLSHHSWIPGAAAGLLCDGPEDGMDVGNIGDPRGIDGKRQPGLACGDSKKHKRFQPVRERQAPEKPQAVCSASNRKDHD